MKKYVLCGAVTVPFFAIACLMLTGSSKSSTQDFADTRFMLVVCTWAGINATLAVGAAHVQCRYLPQNMRRFWMRVMAPVFAGMAFIGEGLLLVEAGRLRDLGFFDLFFLVGAPEFFGLYLSYSIVERYLQALLRNQSPEDTAIKKYVLLGGLFQIPMACMWIFRRLWWSSRDWDFTPSFPAPSVAGVLGNVGLTIMVVCMLRIYRAEWRGKQSKLITTDFFFLTRHPMYHGMFLSDLQLFFKDVDLASPFWWLTAGLFWALLLAAGWFQEKETLARWGTEAKEYYARTPRFIFEWLWFWRVRQNRLARKIGSR